MVQHGGLRMVVCLEEHQVHMLQGRSTFLDDESEMDMRLFWSRPVPNEDTIDNKYIHAKTERMCLWSSSIQTSIRTASAFPPPSHSLGESHLFRYHHQEPHPSSKG